MEARSVQQEIITRFPPSPTGPLHIGNVRTALFNYFFARHGGGKFIVRVEDTDRVRSEKKYELDMLEHLAWLGLTHDEKELWHQSERTAIYKSYLDKLLQEGKAYISQETGGENREVVRFKNPNKTVAWNDLVRGEVSIDTSDVGDFIIARNINDPVYHLAVVVDDFEAGVTHIIRGEDHISNTPRHMLIQEAIGAPHPTYAHIPLLLASDRSKLSKRKHGESVSLAYYKNKGYLPEAIVNYLALLGWNPGTDQEIFTLEEIIAVFDISKVQKGGAIVNEEKLAWINREHLKRLPEGELRKKVAEYISKSEYFTEHGWKLDDGILAKIIPILMERISAFGEITDMVSRGDLDYFFADPSYSAGKLVWKDDGQDMAREYLRQALAALEPLTEGLWDAESVKEAVWPLAEKEGKGSVLWPMRVALSGKDKSPDPFVLAGALGKKTAIERIENAIKILS